MASNWSRNVIDEGLGQFGCTLCARMLAAPQLILTNSYDWDNFDRPAVVQFLITEGYALIGVIDKVPGHPNFPFGYDVTPA